ncbi:nuclear transport factor 2 family protein [Halobacteriales archaeon QH_7_66_36]|nr:MAG: nuclear transport factor 2 family protein [Halobacteriales archaeon QH_7_66_36]
MDRRELARAYYEAIDADEYERLRGLLADDFRQERGDMTLDGVDAFVRFMREERPETDTSHAVEAVYGSSDGVAVEGVLRRADGSVWFRFVDVFRVEDGRVALLRTYTH